MKLALRVVSLASAVALGLATAGCSSSPSDGRATLLGTVTNVPAQSLQVGVERTNVSTTTNSFGQFTLKGLPSGTIVLRFVGGGVDTRGEMSGLKAGMTSRITVQITASGAVIRPAPNEIELTGTIDSITPPNLKISGLTVITDANTEFKRRGGRVSFADLAIGQLVRIEGSVNTNGQVVARKIWVFVHPGQNSVRVRGVIESITPPNLTISGLTIATDANTRLNVHSLANLMGGDAVQVEGTLRADGTVLARSIEKLARDEEEEDEVEFEGAIQSVTPPTLTVADKTVLTNSATKIGEGDGAVRLSDLQIGDQVEVEDKRLADGSVLATRIEVEQD
jgi:hypothetical protein